ncbi:MAG: alkene reductase [Beijerinckiaceae bacterium]|nr:alkene reductase [Beijerinckiaceae bacterium]
MTDAKLYSPVKLGALTFDHRVIMAPLTRMRSSQPGNVPNELMATYYGQRASKGGLIVSEATQVSQQGQGYPATPGIHSDEQVAGWRKITDAVHAKGGLIVLQLWHVGRTSHSSFQPDGGLPVAPSAIAPKGKAFTAQFQQVPFETPRALETDEIPGIVEAFRKGAENAKAAGFDGVEVHSANGYLLDQFLQDGSNTRSDRYGGSIENRARLTLEVTDAAISVWGAERVGIRLSPYGTFGDMHDSDPVALFGHVIGELSKRKLAYLHLIEPRSSEAGGGDGSNDNAPDASALFRDKFDGKLISAGGFTRESAEQAVETGTADAVAFGRIFIANPDLPERLRKAAPLNAYDRATFYGGGEAGYTDYPTLEEAKKSAA